MLILKTKNFVSDSTNMNSVVDTDRFSLAGSALSVVRVTEVFSSRINNVSVKIKITATSVRQ